MKGGGMRRKPLRRNRPRSRIPTEESEQKTLFQWVYLLRRTYPELEFLFHIPNSGAGPLKGQAGKMRALGVKPGVADLFLPIPRRQYSGLWIELKRRRGGKLGFEQKEWLEKMAEHGFATGIARGHREALVLVVHYLTGENLPAEQIKKRALEGI